MAGRIIIWNKGNKEIIKKKDIEMFKYKTSIEIISPKSRLDFVKTQKQCINYYVKQKIVTHKQAFTMLEGLNNWSKHFSHSVVKVVQKNIRTNEEQVLIYVITSSENTVIIKPSISQKEIGEEIKTSNVILIGEHCYITSHSLISAIDLSTYNELEFQELKYDQVKGYYVFVDKYNESLVKDFTTLTKENVEKICINVVNSLDDPDTKIKKIDITSTADIKNDVVSLKVLEAFKKGIFENKTYQEQGKIMDEISDNCTKIEKDFNILINANINKKPEE